jgi:beta-galactosidase/beta-glucuronidase
VYISSISVGQNSVDTLTVSAAIDGSADKRASRFMVTFSVYESGSAKVVVTGAAAPGTAVSIKIPSPQLWGPGIPNLYDLKVTLARAVPSSSATSAVDLDQVVGYFGLRSFRVGKQQPNNVTRPLLNGKFTFLAGWLDQSWWPDGQYTAPTDDALASDVHAVPLFGLNMIRLHMKVNPERWYYHADNLGVVVFQDMVQKICVNSCTQAMLAQYISDLKAMIIGRRNHPCIVQFTLLNEIDMWHLFNHTMPYDLPGLLKFARNLAPDHLIDMESGANGVYSSDPARASLGDVVDLHTYPAPTQRPNTTSHQYAMLGEFGGVGAFVAGKVWRPPTPTQKSCFAYNLPSHPLATPADEADAYIKMTDTLVAWSNTLSASVYTQISDVELECDGFLNYDRTNKFDDATTEAIKLANQRLTQPKG